MNVQKFHLKSFFKEQTSKSKSLIIENTWIKINPILENCQKAIKKIGQGKSIEIKPPKSLKEIYDECQNHWAEHKNFKDMPFRQLKNLFFILFANPNEGVEKGIYDSNDQFEDFLNILIQKDRQLYLRRLISELLFYYPKDSFLFDRLAKIYLFLDQNRRSHQPLILANQKFDLIKENGPAIMAQNILDTNKDLDSTLNALWLKEKHLSSNGIGQAIVTSLCQSVQIAIQNEDQTVLDRFLEYLINKKSNTTRYSDTQPIVKALLNPFKDRKPQKIDFKKKITKFLDQNVGDPRQNPEKWINMPDQRQIFLKWKIDETIQDFLDLLSYTAQENIDADRMWPYRKEFIEYYWKAGHVSDAWIVLGKKRLL